MSDVLGGKFSMMDAHIEMCDDTGHVVNATLDDAGMDKLRWLIKSRTENVFSHRTIEWELFFGPYIKGKDTGYIFQFISIYSRNVYNLTIPFNSDVSVDTIKENLSSRMTK